MPKPISPTFHGILDYLTVPLLLVAGPLFGFDGLPAKITSTLAGVILVYAASTAYPPGLVRLLSLKAHQRIDIVLGAGLIASPWIFRFQHVEPACWFFIALGVLALVIVSLTDFTEPAARPS
jgi:hypothetical protein